MSQNKNLNLINRAIAFLQRQLTLLQKIYLKYFKKTLDKYNVDSPAQLNEKDRAVFFQEIEEAWQKECEIRKIEIEEEAFKIEKKLYELEKASQIGITETEILSESESADDANVDGQHDVIEASEEEVLPIDQVIPELDNDKGEGEPIGIQKYESKLSFQSNIKSPPRGRTKDKGISNGASRQNVLDKTNIDNESHTDVTIINSIVNSEQSDDLTIGYHPNSFFMQANHYNYPVVKMPKDNAFLKLPRKGRAMGKGYKEDNFYNAIVANFSGTDVEIDLHLTIPYYNKPYEPDIVLIVKELNLYIDIEIDEPYDGYYRYPTHSFDRNENTDEIVKKDNTRDLFFTESGWVVIRFTERQVHLQEAECIAYIKDVLNSIVDYHFAESSSCISETQWSYQQAVRWEKEHYREKYLNIEKFGKQISTSKIVVDVNHTEVIENNIERTKKFKSSNLQNNIAFEDKTHVYHHSKDETGNAEYISVTTLIERFFPFDIERFIQIKSKIEEKSKKDVLAEFLKMRDEASEKGTYMHEQIENFLNGDTYDANSKEFEMFKIFYQQIVIAKGFKFVEAEKKVLLDEYNVAGTIDALFKKPNKEEYLILDWKRSKKLIIDGHPKKYGHGYALSELSYLDNSSYYKYALQQNIYKYILEKEYDMRVSSMNLIVLHEKFDNFYRINLVNMDKEVSVILNSLNHKI